MIPAWPMLARAAAWRALLIAMLLALSCRAHAEPLVRAVGPIAITVADADRAAAFYTRVLGFERVSDAEATGPAYERLLDLPGVRARIVRLRLGDEAIELIEFLTPRGRPVPADSRSHDRWFQHVAIVVSDMDRAHARLRDHGVTPISPAPQRLPDWNAAAAGIRAFYFKDPDGHPLELIWFPPGKGAARWHRAGDRLFLGIDHTAIAVADTDRSLACYRDALGLGIAGASDNHGPEQERLNAVAGAHLRITTLRAEAGPGIELLQYLAPADGRPAPGDTRANDLWHWQTVLHVADAGAVARRLRGGACGPTPGEGAGAAEPALGLLGRDPDLHVLAIREP